MLPFKPVYDPSARINVQYQRFGFCRYLADVFGVQLNFDNLPPCELSSFLSDNEGAS
jgi:hypothetical protein